MNVSEFGIGSLIRIVLLFHVFFIFASVSILRRKKSNITIATEEQMLLLRAYMVHPSSWYDIVNDVKANIDQLNDRTREQTGHKPTASGQTVE